MASTAIEHRKTSQREERPLFPDSKAWMKFYHGCPNKATRKNYQNAVDLYLRFIKMDDPEKLLEGTPEEKEDHIMEFIQNQKMEGLSGDLISQRISAIKKFYKKNRMAKLIDWEYVREDIGDIPRRSGMESGGDDYLPDNVQAMRNIADERESAVLLLYWSSGIREGVAPELTWQDLKPINVQGYDIFEITCYRGFKEQYRTWCTPEARKALEAYKEFRERYGETITAHSPVFRDKFDTDEPFGAKYPHKISEQMIYKIIAYLAERAGLRKRIVLKEGEFAGKQRHPIKAVHGLRKGFDTVCTNAGVTPLWVEFFEGRQLKGQKGRYYRPTDQQLLEGIENKMLGYVHCIDDLTIDEANKTKRQLAEVTAENKELKSMREEWQAMRAEFGSKKE